MFDFRSPMSMAVIAGVGAATGVWMAEETVTSFVQRYKYALPVLGGLSAAGAVYMLKTRPVA